MPRIHLEEPAQVSAPARSSNATGDMTSTTAPPAARASQKRTRFLLTKQSKFGCYTCKKRRIKCDEEQPSCLRCQRSGRVCAGYPPNPLQPSSDRSSTNSPQSTGSSDSDSSGRAASLPPSVAVVPWSRPQQQHYVELGCALLRSDPFQLYNSRNLSVFTTLLPQLSLSSPSVNAAAAAFGAAYEAAVLRYGDTLASDESAKQNGLALRFLQVELSRPDPDYAPLLISSTLLAAAETIQARQQGALAHALGAFGVFANRRNRAKLHQPAVESTPARDSDGLPEDVIDKLEHLCLTIDMQVATFGWGTVPNLPPNAFTETTFEPHTIDELSDELPKMLHASLHFVAEASQETLKLQADLSFELIIKQSQMISWLRQWLASFSELVESGGLPSPVFVSHWQHLHNLKAQCLSMLLAVSNIRTNTQTSWDRYAEEFEEIVRCAEIVLEQKPSHLKSSVSSLLPFSPSPGIIQPLYFTARKYRHSRTRRRAISLLRVAGFEGPFSGNFEADLATRFTEIEECRPFSMYLRDDEVLLPSDIPDWHRISTCWRLSDRNKFDERTIKFCRRRRTAYNENTGEPTKAAVQESDNWETWEEVIYSFMWQPESAEGSTELLNMTDRPWVRIRAEDKHLHQFLECARLSRDPDWVKSAVGSGEYFSFVDHPAPPFLA